MIVRIVQMVFEEKHISSFQTMFDHYKEQICNQEGCTFLELYQDINEPERFFTYSYWDSEECLNKYRKSTLFKEVWPKTKEMFAQPPTAYSVLKKVSLS
ncbi:MULTISPECIES: putative quinol monooxygenase [Nonlabens]|uniref:putative quinol monooxygenase n=1 Tax=Nonlabens TaxID=363408 RepID=UPI000CF37952|nr:MULTISPECIES: antibiotic biosynthesis monooxygenase [Nonlabens]PQJ18373.1 antibiotic biosynthesis monooxygenase [Nonlabens tegetincola]